MGASPAGAISKKAGVAREFVYQIMPKLIKKGIVEELITKPKKFKAFSMKEAYTILLRHKKEENEKLYSKAMEALKKHENKTRSKVPADFKISLVPSREAPDARIGEEYKNVQKSVDLIFPVGKFVQWTQYYAELCLEIVSKKNLKMRIITQQKLPKLLAVHPEIFTRSLRSKLKAISFKYIEEPFSVEMMIFDKQTLFVSTIKKSNINKMIWFRTNNPLLLEMATGYFEAMWECRG